jgi:hypothetical protein
MNIEVAFDFSLQLLHETFSAPSNNLQVTVDM